MIRETAEALARHEGTGGAWERVAEELRAAAEAYTRAVDKLTWTGPGAASYLAVAASYRRTLLEAAERADAVAADVRREEEQADTTVALESAAGVLAEIAAVHGLAQAMSEATGGASMLAAVAWHASRGEEALGVLRDAVERTRAASRRVAERGARAGDDDRGRAVGYAEVSELLAVQSARLRGRAGADDLGHSTG
ncbi:hypothetical protein Afil01_15880 [Actinorhabdospora filicis]|uniref:PPE domain-containing protein n=1 Tax=Actinorhabdospora filicis TaxID=1785913 RepID=A0A9W6SLG7_9ACTN|nr:PPE domain-containing protein [Actinorhabdospora filicis]GLZ76781.1 hypothetical protein Afil01_15880 [Actinorhabdospora filicis]